MLRFDSGTRFEPLLRYKLSWNVASSLFPPALSPLLNQSLSPDTAETLQSIYNVVKHVYYLQLRRAVTQLVEALRHKRAVLGSVSGGVARLSQVT